MIALRRSLIPYAVLAAAVLAAFGASLTTGFHFDDYSLFGNPAITSPGGWLELLGPGQTRPLTYLSFWFNYAIGGESPVGYHALSLLLHLATVLLLYGALVKLMPVKPAFIAAALFAIHPIQTEPVVYIFARATLLMTLFCVLSLRSWLAGRRWVAVVWFALALLGKEECAAFPLFLLMLHFSQTRKRREYAPIAVMVGLALAAGGRVIYVLSQTPDAGAGAASIHRPARYLLAQGAVIWRYLRLLVVPHGFTVDPEIGIPPVTWGVVAWIALAGLAVWALRWFRGAGAGFWFLGGLILLLPSSSIFPADDLAADRRMYLPLLAFAAAIALLASRFDKRLLAAAGLVLIALTMGRVHVWRSERTLWAEAVERAPHKLRPRLQLARASDAASAIELLREAARLAPEDPRPQAALGRRLLELQRPGEALAAFGRALALAPRDPLAYNNRGVALLLLGQRDAAREDFERALRLDACLFDARLNLLRMGVTIEAPGGCRYTVAQREALVQAR